MINAPEQKVQVEFRNDIEGDKATSSGGVGGDNLSPSNELFASAGDQPDTTISQMPRLDTPSFGEQTHIPTK